MHAGARSLVQRIGRRGAYLVFLALLDGIYAFGLGNPTARSSSNPTTLYLMKLMPLAWWAVIWAAVGIVCLIYAFRVKDAIAYGAAIALKVGWAVTFLLGWLIGDVERGYLSTAIWGAFAAVTFLIAGWRENSYIERATLPDPLPARRDGQ